MLTKPRTLHPAPGRFGPVLRAAVFFSCLCAFAGPLAAHQSGLSTFHLEVDEARLTGVWELSAVDALVLLTPAEERSDALPIARNLAPGEIEELGAMLLTSVLLESDGARCGLTFEGPVEPSNANLEGARASVALEFSALCPAPVGSLRIRYPMLFDLDPKHRGYYSVRDFKGYQAGVFTSGQQEAIVDVRQFSVWEMVSEYAREGIWHIATGFDHLLFLIALLLPSVLVGREGDGDGGSEIRLVTKRVLWIVSAFTLAHSITLSLAFLGVVRLPSGPVEILIALSVFIAAWNNVRPFLLASFTGAAMAFGFGLVHGFGFAGALSKLGLPAQGRVLALLSFNLGVEAGQLAVVALVLPVIYAVRRTSAYERWGVRGGSLLIAWLAVVWILERALGVDLVPWL